ncbi:MAG: AMP-binding protein, partial [Sphingomonas sp.]|nr:AMP-binding protein [Sphingomonas sp.]
MLGGMQDFELRVPRLIDHAEREHATREIVTHWADGHQTRTNWAGIARDARKLAQALEKMGCRPGDRIATLAMNHAPHLVSWYGAIGMGGVIHTINPRLFDEQLIYIANHAEDQVLFYDKQFQPIIDRLAGEWTTIRHYVAFDSDGPDGFDALIAPEDGNYRWVEGPERDPCMLCYTSGTTGNPKGVLYEHRSTMLHAMCEVSPAVFNLSARASVLPVVPMFHAASWGLPFAGALSGAKVIYSQVNDAAVLCRLMNEEHVTHSAGVPTVWLSMFQHIDATGEAPQYLQQVTIGGSAAPRAMIERIMGMGVEVKHLWGMTETSPIGTAGAPPPHWDAMTLDEKLDLICKQGQIPFGIELRIIDDAGVEQPRDGMSSGRLQVRGPWVVRRYFKADT